MMKSHFYHLVMTNIAMENPRTKCWFLAGKIIYFYGPSIFHGELLVITSFNGKIIYKWAIYTMAMLNNYLTFNRGEPLPSPSHQTTDLAIDRPGNGGIEQLILVLAPGGHGAPLFLWMLMGRDLVRAVRVENICI